MREILFKGKRVDNGEWLEGYYAYNIDDDIHIIYTTADRFAIEVVGATVCQYTGLIDRNGKRIFEGDTFNMGYSFITYTTVWHDTGFIGKIDEQGLNSTNYIGLEHHKNRIQITGNIHD
jgi:uncharacterized phage protein (TIGR01671 family)